MFISWLAALLLWALAASTSDLDSSKDDTWLLGSTGECKSDPYERDPTETHTHRYIYIYIYIT